MTPAARVQAAIELLDEIIAAASGGGAPADRLVANYFKTRRYAGSKDRRAVRELVFGAIRACGPMPKSGRAAMLSFAETDSTITPLFDGSGHGPESLGQGEKPAKGGIAPDWLVERLAASDISGDEAAALLDRAPLDIRVNTLKADRASIELPDVGELLAAPQAVRLPAGTAVQSWSAFREGQIEIQDHGSQIACLAVNAKPGDTVIDLCAGAGGKTLSLAASMENSGRLIASDTDRGRLSQLAPRAERAGAGVIEARLLDPGKELEALDDLTGAADAVLVDAPCSGTGTWRRNPESRWRLTPVRLARLVETQANLLRLAAQLMKPGGRLVYVTCSLLDEEGAEQVSAFLTEHGQWTRKQLDLPLGTHRGEGYRLTPHRDQTDGFFIACLENSC
ncbi:RsmB/NOP family class I SAM-dependent RNA methyltransferase [Altererythrobacter sp. MF3-039]|uniref:RsmB/NOP family class I SAM-dependent RNA methyltransferase n=1 Tax=Altererythrobacter sp. MF3-039 TaxID=3252901 RepID=UPI00390CAE6F